MPNNMGHYLNSINWHLMYKYCSALNNKGSIQDEGNNSNNNNNNNSQKQNKLTCRYDIQIEN